MHGGDFQSDANAGTDAGTSSTARGYLYRGVDDTVARGTLMAKGR